MARRDAEPRSDGFRDAWLLFRAMLREEARLHTALFGGGRFWTFPVFVAVASALTVAALQFTGTETTAVVAGVHGLVLAFGLYTGTAGLVGDDLLDRVLGDTALLMSASSFLPISRRRLLGVFLVKDATYYVLLFVLPVAVGFAPLIVATQLAVAELGAVALSLVAVYVIGMTATFVLLAVRTRGVPGWLFGLLLGGALVTGWMTGLASGRLATVVPAAPLTATLGLVASAAIGMAALWLYDPTYRNPTQTATNQFGRVSSIVSDDTGLVTRTLLDLSRSSGGVLKPVVSTAILLALTAFLVDVAGRIVGVRPAPGIFFGSMLGLSAFTTYNWLTQFDAIEDYLVFPVSVPDVFRAKRTAFLLVGLPTGAAGFGVAVVVYDVSLTGAILGGALFVGLSLYLFGVTVFLAGLDPNEFLFDTARFAAFTASVALPVVPVLLVAFAVETSELTPAFAGALLAASVVLAVTGTWLSGRAGPRWEERYLER